MKARGRGGDVARGRGRGVHAICGAAGHLAKPAAKPSGDSDDNSKNNVSRRAETTHTGPGKGPTPHRPHRAVTMVTENGTELPKKLNNKVFIDGLPYEKNVDPESTNLEEELKQFAIAWKVGKPIRLIKKKGQGFGFLVFQSPHSVDVAVRVLNGRQFLGRSLRVEVPKVRDSPSAEEIAKNTANNTYSRQVLLSDLAKVAQPEIIGEILRDVAPQLAKRLESIKMTSNNRKAFLTFLSPEDVGPAVRFFDGFSMLGRRVSAAPAAAPGSLPYSKVPCGKATVPERAAAGGKSNNVDADHVEIEDEIPVLPLGVEAPTVPLARKLTERKPVPKAEGLPSNVTGVTEKYNLLDTGSAEIFVGNLGEEITEEQLRSHFAVCGKIEVCEILVNKATSLPTGIAHIVFALPAYAGYAQKHLHGSRLHGHDLRVDRGEERSAPLVSELIPREENEDAIDEDGYMEHYGIKDKTAYFKGTSLEQGGRGSKRSREGAADSSTVAKKSKASKVEPSGLSAGDRNKNGSGHRGGGKKSHDHDDDDEEEEEEERFYDVDEVSASVATPANQCGKKKKKGSVAPKQAAKAKKSFR